MRNLLALLLMTASLAAHADELTGTWRAVDGMPGAMKFGPKDQVRLAPDGNYEPLLGQYVATGHFLEIRPKVKTWQVQTSWFEVRGRTLTLRYDSGVTQHFVRKD